MIRKTPYDSNLYNGFALPDRKSYAALCRRKTDMVTRGKVEAAFAKNLIFITLTYDNKHLPTTYKAVKTLPLFHQRITRKKFWVAEKVKTKIVSFSDRGNDCKLKLKYIDDGYKWFEKDCKPINCKGNVYRHKDIFDEQDFKNAKFKFAHSAQNLKKKNFSLLVPEHLQDFLQMMRDLLRKDFNDPHLRLRFVANGEYGGNTNRAHYHILLFNNLTRFDSKNRDISQDYFDAVVRMLWNFGKILQIKVVEKDETAVKKLTSYIVGHTVKNDSGNKYQSELSPAFRLSSTYDGGLGHQLVDCDCSKIDDPFVRSLNTSLSAWDKKSSLKYKIRSDDNKKMMEFEFPRYYKDKVQNYQSKDVRMYVESYCRMARNLCKDFCKFYGLYGQMDMLDVYLNIGLCATPKDILTLFMISNRKKLPNFLAQTQDIGIFADNFFSRVRLENNIAAKAAAERAKKRKQEKKYQDYLTKSGFYDID